MAEWQIRRHSEKVNIEILALDKRMICGEKTLNFLIVQTIY